MLIIMCLITYAVNLSRNWFHSPFPVHTDAFGSVSTNPGGHVHACVCDELSLQVRVILRPGNHNNKVM